MEVYLARQFDLRPTNTEIDTVDIYNLKLQKTHILIVHIDTWHTSEEHPKKLKQGLSKLTSVESGLQIRQVLCNSFSLKSLVLIFRRWVTIITFSHIAL